MTRVGPDLRSWAEKCELTAIEVRSWGERSFHARDPFENPICFVDSQTLFTGEHAWAGTPPTT